MVETRPPQEHYAVHHHWLISERASNASISEWINGNWYSSGEVDPISPLQMAHRGWDYGGPAVPSPEQVADFSSRSGFYVDEEETDEPTELHKEFADTPTVVEPKSEAIPLTPAESIKDLLHQRPQLRLDVVNANDQLRYAKGRLDTCNEKLMGHAKKLLEQEIGSIYDAKDILFLLRGEDPDQR